MSAAGLPDAHYIRNVLTSPPDPKTESGSDLRALKMAAARFAMSSDHQHVFDVLSSGPILPAEISQFTDVYKRGMRELRRFFTSA